MTRSLLARLRAHSGRIVDPASRRQFLASSLAASAWMLSSRSAFAHAPAPPAGKSIVVVGAGLSGLACAYELKLAGYDVRVFEASNRLGGRVRSVADFLPGRNVEFGGELIGSNHPTWVAYKEKFGLEFLELSDPKDECFNPFMLGGKVLGKDECKALDDAVDKAFLALDEDGKRVFVDEPWKTKDAAALDQRSFRDWLDKLDAPADVKLVLGIEFYANNGQELGKQSYLGNLCSIQGGGGAQKYREESEVYRCKGGNQSLARALAKEIGDRVFLEVPVKQIEQKDKNVVVTGKDGREVECDDVVLAVPPTVWDKITFNPGLPAVLKPQMGSNVKYFSGQKQRIWDQKDGFSQYALADGNVSMTWEGTDKQEGDGEYCLVAFSGAHAAEACRALKGKERELAYAAELEKLLPGSKANATGKTAFMDWPSEPWTRASYSFPAPGEVTTVGPKLRDGHGHVHFAGEHCCYKFVGYMEGALNSGAALAQRLAVRDGLLKK
ncbi:MAG TPA: FAD-dependent oxidoreductase [Planctomycetota bacterium]|nr:FAD-dependent oxidoreductase [Planctomycetota bacterium]